MNIAVYVAFPEHPAAVRIRLTNIAEQATVSAVGRKNELCETGQLRIDQHIL